MNAPQTFGALCPNGVEQTGLIETILDGQQVDPRVRVAAERAAKHLEATDSMRARVKMRVIQAFLDEGLSESDLAGSTGYGYDDAARDRYESLLARYFRAEKVLARLSIVSGTHAIVASLDALTPSGRTLLCANGAPYDTLTYAIAHAPYSLVSRGVTYVEVPRTADGRTDEPGVYEAVRAHNPAVVFVQRSRGYAARQALRIDDIAAIVREVRRAGSDAPIVVDNCYGELVEDREPLEVGADIAIGSLIKNIGGGIAPTGGYIAGRADLIDRIATRIYAPGIGAGLGPTLGVGRQFIQGLFYAPLVVGETLRGLNFTAALFAELGFAVDPPAGQPRTDIVQAIRLETAPNLIAFARGLQRALPVNARFRPEPGSVPGYVDPVIMSGGSFINGATIDLSCDAPLRAPYEVYIQGGIMAEHAVLGAVFAATEVVQAASLEYNPPMFRKRPPAVSTSLQDSVQERVVQRRRFERAPVVIAADYIVEGVGDQRSNHIDDLGGGGVRLETNEDLVAGTTIALRFAVAGKQIDATGKVVMSLFDASRNCFLHGVAFTAIHPAQQAVIVEHVAELRSKTPG